MADCPSDPTRPELELVCRAARAAEQAAAAASRLADRGSALGDWAELIQAVGLTLLPVAAVVVLWRLFGPISTIIASRKFTIKVGPFELSAQEAAEQLVKQVEDLQRKVAELEKVRSFETLLSKDFGVKSPQDAEPAQPLATLNILWVDDRPQNNAFEIASLEEAGHRIRTVLSSAEAEAALRAGRFDVILSDMGRPEGRDAGIGLLRDLRATGDARPFGFYTSRASLERHGAEIRELGAFVATSSYIDLKSAIDRIAAEATG